MKTARPNRRALVAAAAVAAVAAVSIPPALAAMGSTDQVSLGSPTISAAHGSPAEPAPDAPETDRSVAPAPVQPALDMSAVGESIADGIITRLSLPTGPVLQAAPVAAPEAVASAPTSSADAVDAAPSPDRNLAPGRTPARDRRPARTESQADHIEVEVYGAAIPEPPEVASSTTTETVLVEPDPADPWRAVRQCESNGNYSVNTGNGFYGAYQFTIRTWDWVAGIIGRRDLVGVRPDLAAPADQDRMATALAFEVAGGGLGHWPVCGRLYGS